jgi:hypothetical protein
MMMEIKIINYYNNYKYMDSTIIMLLIIVSMILLFAASNTENFVDTISNVNFENIKEKMRQVKVKLVEPILKPNALAPTKLNGITNIKMTTRPESKDEHSAQSGPSNAVILQTQIPANINTLKAYNDDLDNEHSANFGDQSTEINQFIKSTGKPDALSWSERSAEMHNNLKNSNVENIIGTSAFDYNEGTL